MIFVSGYNFILSTKDTSYAFGVNREGMLEHMHYGSKITIPKNKVIGLFGCHSKKIV